MAPDRVLLATIPLDVYGHSDVTITKEVENFDFPNDNDLRDLFARTFKFTLDGHTISTRLIFMNEPFESEGKIYYYGAFHPISLMLIRRVTPSWRHLSKSNIGELKNRLGSEGWAVRMPA